MITHVRILAPFEVPEGQLFLIDPDTQQKLQALAATLVIEKHDQMSITPDGAVKRAKWTVVEVVSNSPVLYREKKRVVDTIKMLLEKRSFNASAWGQITFKFLQEEILTVK